MLKATDDTHPAQFRVSQSSAPSSSKLVQFKAYDLEGRLFDTFELIKARDR
jgi:hypothetical protein